MWSKSPPPPAKETTPLIPVQRSDAKKHWDTLRTVTFSGIAFRRAPARRRLTRLSVSKRMSVRGSLAFAFFAEKSVREEDKDSSKDVVEPIEALCILVPGGKIYGQDGIVAGPRPTSIVKSIPAFAPYRRMARHRSFYLWWTVEFRHWWKSSRLLVRLAGLDTQARDPIFWAKMVSINPLRYKSLDKMSKLVKRLGQGGPMRFFLDRVHPFTRSVRIFVAAWRWIEAAPCRRLEVGIEETIVSFVTVLCSFLLSTLTNILKLVPLSTGFHWQSCLPYDRSHSGGWPGGLGRYPVIALPFQEAHSSN